MIERKAITVRGIVQGVGFRPFVYRLAQRFGVSGFVKNCVGSVLIEVEGERGTLNGFLSELQSKAPPRARIESISSRSRSVAGTQNFTIAPSDLNETNNIVIGPDIATCPACLDELFHATDRRYRYALLNCTDCGPRMTIIQTAPYDRHNTTMSAFTMCDACRAEYDNPMDRRFHAQPIACPDCGPRLAVHQTDGQSVEAADPLVVFVRAIQRGEIGALKGLGGYHLVCDARNQDAVSELRRRKHRDEKPFAIMLGDAKVARRLCHVNAKEEELLTSPARPIVLLRKREHPEIDIAATIAPANTYLGVMLPSTPLHHLLIHDIGDIPLVMTSGNQSDEPIAYQDDDAIRRLAGIADIFLMHNRPIHVRCDDSVARVVAGEVSPLRRARGFAPAPLRLPIPSRESVLAVGGQQKNTFALGRGQQAIVSHHLGDLEHFAAYQAFERDIALYENIFAVAPKSIAHDLHPDYASTNYAKRRATSEGLSLLPVQHHHAHMASCMAEHALNEPVIGVSFDGTGYGTDSAIWGGEFLVGDYANFSRAAHLRYVRMPGSANAINEPWRMAAAHLIDAKREDLMSVINASESEVRIIRQLIRTGFSSPWTSSVGRLFDAVAAIAGVRETVSYEGQAAMELESLATSVIDTASYPFEFDHVVNMSGQPTALSAIGWKPPSELDVINARPLIAAVARDARTGVQPARIARRFHNSLVKIIIATCDRIRGKTGIDAIVLSGGVFQNAILTSETQDQLVAKGFRTYSHRVVPANDGGLSFGQLAVAAAVANQGNICGSATQPVGASSCA